MNVFQDVCDYANELKGKYKDLSTADALQVAAKMVEINAYREANLTDREGTIPVLEAIGIGLGVRPQLSHTVPEALSDVSSSIDRLATAAEGLKQGEAISGVADSINRLAEAVESLQNN